MRTSPRRTVGSCARKEHELRGERSIAAAFAALALLLSAPSAAADHVYPSGAHWSLDAVGGVVTIEEHLGSEWDAALAAAIGQWERSAGVRFDVVTSGTCDDGVPEIEVCAAPVPGVSWIALTSVYRGDDVHLDHAAVELNLAKRWSKAKRRFALCHELGHAIGLTHRPETSGSSCMLARFALLTDRPARADAHDLETVDGLYAHIDAA